jgi:RNA polymerase sigma-70 factor (ECF subfamily)
MVQRRETIRSAAAESSLLSESDLGTQAREAAPVLVGRARRGDVEAFDELYRLHRDKVYTLCLNLCRNREQAEDLLQETFVRAWRGLRKFRGASQFSTWLHRIAINVCRDAAPRRNPQLELLTSAEPDEETVDRVRAALGRLRTPHRVVLVLRYTLSLSYQEIAETLNWSLSKVKVTLHRAKAAFRDVYCEEDGIEP